MSWDRESVVVRSLRRGVTVGSVVGLRERCCSLQSVIKFSCCRSCYDTIRYDSVYLTCSKKPTGSQLSLPHGISKKLKCETKNKMMSLIGPVQSRCHKGSPVGKRKLRWEGFVEKVGFEPGVKE